MDDLSKYRNVKGKIWVNVASSTYILEDFVNLDNSVFLNTLGLYHRCKMIIPRKYWQRYEEFAQATKRAQLVRHDCRKPLFFPSGSVDHILCSHFLEHVFPVEMEAIIKDFHRVLKVGGTLEVLVPDLELLARRYVAKTGEGDAAAADDFIMGTLLSKHTRGSLIFRLLEFLGSFGLQHYWMYDRSSLAAKLKHVGFSLVETAETPSQQFRLGVEDGSLRLVFVKAS